MSLSRVIDNKKKVGKNRENKTAIKSLKKFKGGKQNGSDGKREVGFGITPNEIVHRAEILKKKMGKIIFRLCFSHLLVV